MNAKSNKIKTVIMVVSIVLAIALAGGWIAQSVVGKQKEPARITADESDGSGLLVTPLSTNTMRLTATSHAESGSSYILTATITPSNAGDKGVDWSVNWNDSSASWVSGKSVTDYVAVTPASDGELTATVTCKKSFGEQIKVTVTSRENGKYYADCICDYSKKITGFNITGYAGYNSTDFALSDETSSYTFDKPSYCFNYTSTVVTFNYSDYTVDDKFTTTYKATINSEYSGYLSSAGLPVKQTALSFNYFWGGSYFFYFYTSVPGGMREVSFCGFTAEQANDAVLIAKQHTDIAAYNWTINCKGTYSAYEHTIPVYFSDSSLTAVVTGVSLDNSSLMY